MLRKLWEEITQNDGMIIKDYGTIRLTDKKTGEEMSRYRPMSTHFNETCSKRHTKTYFNISQTKDSITPLLHWRMKNVIIYRMKKTIF